MRGYIINLNRVKEEDLIVTIVAKNNLYTLYRFYGARHGVINLGFKIDFEIEESNKGTISRLKDVIHIGYKWINDHNKLRLWQDFLILFFKHLKDSEDIGNFYFTLLEECEKKWDKQNPKRVAVEAYIKLLKHEGRLHKELQCFLCSQEIKEDISLIRAFLPTHEHCSHTLAINRSAIKELYTGGSSMFLTDTEVNRLWNIILEGL